jgi:hypothetical protein
MLPKMLRGDLAMSHQDRPLGELAEIMALREKATEGEWFAREYSDPQWAIVVGSEKSLRFVCLSAQKNDEANMRYIAALHNLLPALEKLVAKARLEAVEEYKKSLDVPELEDFAKGTIVEAQHQRQRWGDEHDTSKEPEEWFWLVGYLAGKGLHAQRAGNMEKFKHHLITGAAVLANWHARTVADLRRAAGKQ